MVSFLFQISPPSSELSIWDLAVKGGWLMIPIFILSIVGIYILCERWYVIYKVQKSNRIFLSQIEEELRNKKYKELSHKCLADNSPAAKILYKGIKYKHLPVNDIRVIMENGTNESIASVEKGFSTLAMVSSIAPMIGFLGTVIGMVQAFYDMSLAGNNINITLLSRGIYTAMITTVAGLIVGIIALLGYNILVSKVDKIANDMDKLIEKFIESLYTES